MADLEIAPEFSDAYESDDHSNPALLNKLAGNFEVLPNDNPVSDAKRNELIDKPAFGQIFSDNMVHMSWTKGEGWSDRRVEPYGPLKMDPGASVLHYAQECFEGLKAYKRADGSVWLFRPDINAARFQNSAKRLYLPDLSIDDFIGSVAALVKRDREWVPSRREYTLYMRPFMFASEPFLGVREAHEVEYCVIASPSGPYFKGGLKPVSIWVEDQWFRTGPGGTGFAKCGGNYAASLLGEYKGIEHGCEQVCFVDAATKTYLEELGGMNMFALHKDGHLETPSLTGSILPGVTRRSLIQLAKEAGHDVVETMIPLQGLLDDIRSGEVTEVFACGTAAIITPIGRFKSDDFDLKVSDGGVGELTQALRDELLGIQLGDVEDKHNWMWKVCD
ncbi:branched-chain amino acid aminotransferase [Gardnerella greenwoodii]|uniref:branched-chain amino acid aminotransferase n=1 Tax=Gardnerella greenwoodii TaxID=2914925 RepID=UPI0039F1350E